MGSIKHNIWKYAPLYAITYAGSLTLAKSIGQRYILKREWTFDWSDAMTAFGGATLGYLTFRAKYGNKLDGWYKR